ncbi:MAG: hypothetical protein ACI85O_001416 [Saprospiraceae bacterium]|jgi:hypothetical protein
MKFERQYIVVDAFVSNTGKLRNWEFDDHYNLKESNEHFLREIEKQVDRIMKSMNEWRPGKLSDKNVNCWIGLDINLESLSTN